MAAQLQCAFGSFRGTGAAITIAGEKVGFKPRYIKLLKQDGATSAVLEWQEGMGDAKGIKDDDVVAEVTANGITPTSTGFTLGTDAFNADGKAIFYTCLA